METVNKRRRAYRRPMVVALGLSVLAATAGCATDMQFGAPSTDDVIFEVAVATADGMVSTGDGAATAVDRPLTNPDELAKLVDLPGDPVGVWYWSVPVGTINEDDRVPGPTDYTFYAIVEYATPEAAAEAAGPAGGTDEIVVDDWYPQELTDLGTPGEWDRSWLAVNVHQPEPAWADPVYVVDGAPNYIVFNYAEPTN